MAQELDNDAMLIELDQQYDESTQAVLNQLNTLKEAHPQAIRAILKELDVDTKQCLMTIKEMKQELKMLDSKAKWTQRIKARESEYRSLRAQCEKARNAAQRRTVLPEHEQKL